MVLGIADDFTSNISLDSQLTGVPSSGLYINSGVHPSITIENLLAFLPFTDIDFTTWSEKTTYGEYDITQNRKDIVFYNGVIYQSLVSGNVNVRPNNSTVNWLPTNIDSLRLKSFIKKVLDRVNSELHLTKRLLSNQYLYENGEHLRPLPSNYGAVVLEPKGSDYVSIRINQISVQTDGITPFTVYMVANKEVLQTFLYTPNNGKVKWEDVNFVYRGSHPLFVVIESREVYLDGGQYDPFKYEGFTVYSSTGTGTDPETAEYTENFTGKGIGLNVTSFLDASSYIDYNIDTLGNFVRATLEYMAFLTFYHNSNNRSNRAEAIQMRDNILMSELKQMDGADTAVKRFYKERKIAKALIGRTFDTQIMDSDEGNLDIEIGSL